MNGAFLCQGILETFPPTCTAPAVILRGDLGSLDGFNWQPFSTKILGDFELTSDIAYVSLKLAYDEKTRQLVGEEARIIEPGPSESGKRLSGRGDLTVVGDAEDTGFERTLNDLAEELSPAGTIILTHDGSQFIVISLVPLSAAASEKLVNSLSGQINLSSWLDSP